LQCHHEEDRGHQDGRDSQVAMKVDFKNVQSSTASGNEINLVATLETMCKLSHVLSNFCSIILAANKPLSRKNESMAIGVAVENVETIE